MTRRVRDRFSGGDHHGDLSPEALHADRSLAKDILERAGGIRAGLDGLPGATPPSFCYGCVARHSPINGGDDLRHMLNRLSSEPSIRALGEAVNDD